MNELTSFMHLLCDSAHKETLAHFRTSTIVDNKEDQSFDPVTEGDRNAELAIRALINKNHPEHGILGEEFGPENLDAEYVWIIDPIDGTRAFISGVPVWGTLIGLAVDGRDDRGIMYQPFTGERFFSDGILSWYLGPGVKSQQRLTTRDCPSLGDALMMTTSPKIFSKQDVSAYERVEDAVRLTRYGTDCYAYCMIAAGQIDLVVESDLKAYDIAALVPLVKHAGGVISDWEGNPVNVLDTGKGQVVASGCARIHDEALKLLNA